MRGLLESRVWRASSSCSSASLGAAQRAWRAAQGNASSSPAHQVQLVASHDSDQSSLRRAGGRAKPGGSAAGQPGRDRAAVQQCRMLAGSKQATAVAACLVLLRPQRLPLPAGRRSGRVRCAPVCKAGGRQAAGAALPALGQGRQHLRSNVIVQGASGLPVALRGLGGQAVMREGWRWQGWTCLRHVQACTSCCRHRCRRHRCRWRLARRRFLVAAHLLRMLPSDGTAWGAPGEHSRETRTLGRELSQPGTACPCRAHVSVEIGETGRPLQPAPAC